MKIFEYLSINYVFPFLLVVLILFQIVLVYFFLFPRYWKYTIVPGDCNKFCFIWLCNDDYDIKKLFNFLALLPNL